MRRAVALVLLVGAARAGAQVRPEARLEFANTGAGNRVAAGLGLTTKLGPYLRGSALVAHDVWRDGGGTPLASVESHVRFLLDPLAEQSWGLSFAAGLGFRERPYLLVAADLEGPRMRSVRPAIQLALGGGLRLGCVLRRAATGRR